MNSLNLAGVGMAVEAKERFWESPARGKAVGGGPITTPSSSTDQKVRSVGATSSLEGRGDEWLGLGALAYCDTLNSLLLASSSIWAGPCSGIRLRQGSSEWDSLVRREAAWGLLPGKRGVGEACCNSFIFHAHLPGTFWLLIPGRRDVASACLPACLGMCRKEVGLDLLTQSETCLQSWVALCWS